MRQRLTKSGGISSEISQRIALIFLISTIELQNSIHLCDGVV